MTDLGRLLGPCLGAIEQSESIKLLGKWLTLPRKNDTCVFLLLLQLRQRSILSALSTLPTLNVSLNESLLELYMSFRALIQFLINAEQKLNMRSLLNYY